MLTIGYADSFVRRFKKMEPALQAEIVSYIELFKDRKNHRALKVHKLKGALAGKWAFSVDFRNRIIFRYDEHDKSVAYLLDVGDHSVYE